MHAPMQPKVFDLAQVLPGGFHFPTRMTALPLQDGMVALISPIPIDGAIASELAALGQVRFLIAPNLLHNLYLAPATQRYPQAQVIAPAGLARKRPDLRIDLTFEQELPAALRAAIQIVRVEGAPKVDEHVFFHVATRTLVVTDLVFNVRQPQGVVARVVLFCVGCHGRLAQSRAWRFFVKDRVAAAASYDRVLALPTQTLVMAHGEVEHTQPRQRLAQALAWLSPQAAPQHSRCVL